MISFSFYHVFTSHMVLQRERPIVFSGTGEPQAAFTVTFAGRTETGTVGADGRWSVTFPFMNAGGPYTLTAGYSGETSPSVVFDDILIGEVWMCTGQSNMEMPVYSDNRFWRTLNAEEELAHADYPTIRLYNSFLTRRLAPEGPLEDENPDNPGWQPCSRATVASFSACGYFFGRQLSQDLNVPIGLINTAWGGTRVEAWISEQALTDNGWELEKRSMNKVSENYSKALASDDFKPFRDWIAAFDAHGAAPAEWLAESFDDSGWEAGDHQTVTVPRPGRYVVRLHVTLPEAAAGRELTLRLGRIDDADQTYVNGRKVGATGVETETYWAIERVYKLPAGTAKAGDNVIAIVVDDHYSFGTVALSGLSVSDGDIFVKAYSDVRVHPCFLLPNDYPVRPNPPGDAQNDQSLPTSPNYPSTLYNALLNPWFHYAVRGTIWYQGCTNNGQFTYYPLHQLFIENLRESWHDAEMPFLLVQLAAYYQHQPENPLPPEKVDAMPFPEFSPYGLTREIQAELPEVMENVGMITAFDCGDPTDIHPRDKQTLGYRLALKAENMMNWIKRDCDGPSFAGFVVEGKNVRVFFDHAEAGLKTTDGQPPRGFALGTRDGHLIKAQAVIDGDTVVVSSPLVLDPQRVRYAFTGFCLVNLVNAAGFPALPFRSDKPDYSLMF